MMISTLRTLLTIIPRDQSYLFPHQHLRRKSHIRNGKKVKNESSNLYLSLTGEVLYGVQPVSLALQAGRRTINHIYYNKDSARAEQLARVGEEVGVSTTIMDRSGLDQLCKAGDRYKEHLVHQGIVADVSRLYHIPLDYTMPQVTTESEPISREDGVRVWLLLCSIRDPMNLGAILRSAYFLGVERVIVTGARCSLTATVSKASSGALEMTTVCAVRETAKYLSVKQEEGWQVMALTMYNPNHTFLSIEVGKLGQIRQPTILVVGSEGEGVPQDILEFVNKGVHISASKQEFDSLNVSVSVGIVLHRLLSTS